MSATDDILRGKSAVQYFHSNALAYPAYPFRGGVAELWNYLNGRNSRLLLDLGAGIREARIQESVVRETMEGIARDGQGQLPRNSSAWFDALINRTRISNWEAVKIVAEETAKGVGKAAAVAGQTIQAAGGLIPYLPYVAFAGLIFYVYERARVRA